MFIIRKVYVVSCIKFFSLYYKTVGSLFANWTISKITVSGPMKFNVHPTGSIRVKDLRINSGNLVNSFGGHRKMVVRVLRGGELIIGNNVGISNSTLICSKKIVIEDDVLIGGNCHLFDTDFHSTQYHNRMKRPDPDVVSKAIVVRRGAFVGGGSYVLKGVIIGVESIIAAGSVVTKSVPDGEVWGGNPARFIRKI